MAEGGDSFIRTADVVEPFMFRDSPRPAGSGRAHPLGVHSFGRGRAVSSVGQGNLVGGPVATSTPLRDSARRPHTDQAAHAAPATTQPMGVSHSPVSHTAPMPTLVTHGPTDPTSATCSAPMPNTQVITADTLAVVLSHLAKQINDNITASINPLHQTSGQPHPSHSSPSLAAADASRVSVTVQSDAKLPPFFRGDRTDKFSVDEWEDVVMNHLRRVGHTEQEKFDFVMSRLLGKARDVVRVSLRCSPETPSGSMLSAVFDILKRHFSELTYSNMPMRDFYNTLPHHGESAMEYWIRLNKAIDVAEECLRRRQRVLEDPGAELVTMFVSHCPDPSLSVSLSFKPAEKWTLSEIQEMVDARHRALKRSGRVAHVSSSPVSTEGVRPLAQSTIQHTEPRPPPMAPPVLQSCAPAPCESAQPLSPPAAEPSLSHVVNMLDKVLTVCTASMSQRAMPAQRDQVTHRETRQPCRVCGSLQHTTFSHCRMDRLCHQCLQSGHVKSGCPQSQTGAAHAPPTQLN